MALTTYTELKAAIADWLNRTDLTSQIPDFITLAEAEIKRRLRRTSTRTTWTVNAEEVTTPTDMAELRSMSFESGSAGRDVPLRICTPEMLAERRARSAGATGRPTDVAVIAGKFVFAPTPDQSYTARIVYYVQITAAGAIGALSSTVSTNSILTEAPDAYLFGALMHAAPFLEHDERIPIWTAKFNAAIDQLNDVRDREEYNASLRGVRLPVVFG